MFYSAIDEQIFQHYNQFLGEPTRITKFFDAPEVLPGPIFVAEFSLGADGDIIWVYATIGASRYPQANSEIDEGGKINRRFELLIYTYQPNDKLMKTLATLAVYPFRNNTFLGKGHTIAGTVGQSMIDDSPLTDILLLDSVQEPQEFRTLHLDGKHHVDILWVNPIYPSERLYKVEHGLKALVELFTTNEIDMADFYRRSVV